MRNVIAIGLLAACVATPSLKAAQADPINREKIDELLDLYVRDGYVYYRALKAERGKLDAFVASLAGASIESAPRNAQMAFWLNAYNMLVLRTVIDHYPIQQRTTAYPPHSIRQIPGAFERNQHRVAGRMITLDQIEQDVLGFGPPAEAVERKPQLFPDHRGLDQGPRHSLCERDHLLVPADGPVGQEQVD